MTAVNNDIEVSSNEAVKLATQHLRDILTQAIQYTPEQTAIVVYDTICPLAATLTKAYQQCLPSATFIDFYAAQPEDIMAKFAALSPQDLVILIQTTSFRLNAFRLRVDLFHKELKVIEHPHLSRMTGLEGLYYIESLAYDANYYRGVGNELKKLIDQAKVGVVESEGGDRLIFDSPFESAKLNVGDYTGMKNIGGQFPIGEVFTEAQNLEAVNGQVKIFAFGDTSFSVYKLEDPLTLVVTNGRVTDVFDSVPEFDLVLDNIRADENEVWLRELGFGMNRAFSKNKTVADIGTYERMCGIHLSLGAKHNVYKKPIFKRATTWHHVDIFADTKLVYLDDLVVFQNGAWQVKP